MHDARSQVESRSTRLHEVEFPYGSGMVLVESEQTAKHAAIAAMLLDIAKAGSLSHKHRGAYVNVRDETGEGGSFEIHELYTEAKAEHDAFEQCCEEIAGILGIDSKAVTFSPEDCAWFVFRSAMFEDFLGHYALNAVAA